MVRLKDLVDEYLKKEVERNALARSRRKTTRNDDSIPNEKYEQLFQFIGKYVVFFQNIEAEIDQTLLLLIGHERWHLGTKIVARLSISDKIDLLHSTVVSSELAVGTELQKAWVASFEEMMNELKSENARRNKIVHSLYLFDSLGIGLPVLRSKRTKRHDQRELDQEYIDDKLMKEAVGKVAELSFDIGMNRRQLIAWDKSAVTRAPSAEEVQK
jgi:hypothetical protein